MDCTDKRLPFKGILTIIGGFLVHLTLSTQLSYGNINPYLVSYIRNCSSPSDLQYIDGVWMQASMLMGQGVSMFAGGILEVKLGPRIATLIGSWFFSAGVLLTYFTVKTSFITSVITYGVMFGLGCGASYVAPIGAAMRWFPNHRGFVSGAIFLGFNVGSVICNQVATVYVNPHNLSPEVEGENGDIYFEQEGILDRVPTLFLVLGGTYAAMQLIAFFLIADPPKAFDNTTYTVRVDTDKTDDSVQATSFDNDMSEPTKNPPPETPEIKLEDKKPEVEMDIPPLKMLRTLMFYYIWILFMLGGLGGVFLPSQYKAYGQTFIEDDHFFSIVGSCASTCGALSPLFWGWVSDKYTFKTAVQLIYVIFASVSYTFSQSEVVGRAFYLIWVCLIIVCLSGIFGIMPSAIGRIYGNKYVGINYGLTYTSQIVTAAAGAFLGRLLIDRIGYHGMFHLIGAITTLGLLVAIMIQPKTPDGKPV